MFGIVLSSDPDVVMTTEDGRVYEGWAKVKWDPYKGPETLPRKEIPDGYTQEVPFERLEPAKS